MNGYPKTPEAFEARKATGRKLVERLKAEGKWNGRGGVPDGFAGRKIELVAMREDARVEAKELVKIMVAKNIVSKDDEHAQAALEGLVAIVVAKDPETNMPLYGVREVVNAAKALLEFTKSKPASKAELTLNRAEDMLAALISEPE